MTRAGRRRRRLAAWVRDSPVGYGLVVFAPGGLTVFLLELTVGSGDPGLAATTAVVVAGPIAAVLVGLRALRRRGGGDDAGS